MRTDSTSHKKPSEWYDALDREHGFVVEVEPLLIVLQGGVDLGR